MGNANACGWHQALQMIAPFLQRAIANNIAWSGWMHWCSRVALATPLCDAGFGIHHAATADQGWAAFFNRARDEKHLATTRKFAADGFFDQFVVGPRHQGAHGTAIGGWRRDNGQVAQPSHRQMQGSWNRRGREGQDIHVGAQFFKPLLVCDAETLFFVDNQQAQIFDANVIGQDAMGCHHHINAALSQLAHHLGLFAFALKAGKFADVDGEVAEPRGHGAHMLLD